MMTVNGRPRLVCWEVVAPEQRELTLAPLKGCRIIRDLAVDFGELDEE
jgi:succinate dehydrogenase/fumarate reductase-like Fe-S protein